MNRLTVLLVVTFFLCFQIANLTAQEISIAKVPKQLSMEFGYRNVFTVLDKSTLNTFSNEASHGYGFLFDYAWQLSGLNGKRAAAFITVPIGYTIMMPDNDLNKRITMLNYGWTVRHELGVNRKIIPFLGYGLLLNTLKIDGTLGSVMGHQTQFEGGLNFNTATRLKYFAKLQCSYTSYPKMGAKERIHFMYADLRVGVRF